MTVRSDPARPLLLGLPHAGGSAIGAYPGWRGALEDLVQLEPLELPGRGRRVAEAACETLQAAAADCAERVAPATRGAPFALIGHSIGGLLAYELDALLRRRDGPTPTAVIVAGTPAPCRGDRTEALHALPDDRFLAAVAKLGGLPDVVLEHPEARAFHTAVLRADYRLHECYEPADPPHRIDAPLLVLLAADDPLTCADDARRWRRFAARQLTTRTVPAAAHFFPVTHRDETLSVVRSFLRRAPWGG
ncbi:MAG TPA: alpha/beta fold hydrolase [Conexibacter sp.]|jgi:medium-chain acyl-[acyl-carrier-protein] hydrolase|nr:alpha/beta fold hydrolase [Conexibacter sp.]